jgi:hypothetical protein
MLSKHNQIAGHLKTAALFALIMAASTLVGVAAPSSAMASTVPTRLSTAALAFNTQTGAWISSERLLAYGPGGLWDWHLTFQ